MNKIIICGPSSSGKNYLREKFIKRGYISDVSYTSRGPRPGEIKGKDYHFITKEEFKDKIKQNQFYEWTEFKKNYYGTGQREWAESNVFIMDAIGIYNIKSEDREKCFVIFLNPCKDTRIKRMVLERKWGWAEIAKRLDFDHECFKDFDNYDMIITNSQF